MKIQQVYIITNTKNNKVYIGKTNDIKERWIAHKYASRRPTHNEYNSHIHCSMRLYGLEHFKIETVAYYSTECEALVMEVLWIAEMRKYLGVENVYNETDGGEGVSGYSHSDETKIKISLSNKRLGRRPPSFQGKKHDEATKEKISKNQSGELGNGAKINSITAVQIYNEYLNNFEKISSRILGEKYGITDGAIDKIIHKETWKEATKDLPDINFDGPAAKFKNLRSPLTIDQIKNIKQEYSKKEFQDKIFVKKYMNMYNVSRTVIYKIMKNITYKEI